jgi:hypothetical protein
MDKGGKLKDMNRKFLKISAIVGIAILFVVAGIYAKTVPDMIKLEDPAYKKHKITKMVAGNVTTMKTTSRFPT